MLLDNFRTIDRETAYLLPPSVDEWLPERHLARFIVEVIDRLEPPLSIVDYTYKFLFLHTTLHTSPFRAMLGDSFS